MKKLNIIVAVVMFVFGCISFYTNMDTGMDMNHVHMNHGFNWFGLGEMTVMWWVMALAHAVLHSCTCKSCKK